MTARAWGRRQREDDPAPVPPDEALESRLTWLWSTPRSGSALLLELLAYPLRPDMHAALGFRPPPARATVAPDVIPVDELGFAGHFAPWPGEPVEVHERWIPGTLLNLNEGRPSYLLASERQESWRPQLRDLVLGRIRGTEERAFAHVRDLGPGSPIVIKEAFTSHGADRVMGLLPRSRTLMLVRDPRDVVVSMLDQPDAFSEDDGAGDGAEERLALATRTAKLWAMYADVGTAAVDAHEPDLALSIRLEDLLEDPQRELGRVCGWMGLERTPAEVEEAVAGSSIGATPPIIHRPAEPDLGTEPGSWRERLSADESGAVAAIAGPRLAKLGYDAG
jgi:hypothetical protein